ncbi:MAG: PQQ-dependent dehydrogenase, methanol/ethanol family, partial [Bryobacteraceae bacterium]
MRAALLAAVSLAPGLAPAQITDPMLRSAQNDPSTWLHYGKNYASWRYVDLAEIGTRNVATLAPRWIHQTGLAGAIETTPLVFGGVMYTTASGNNAFALDLLTGRPLWRYSSPVPPGAQG